MMIFDDLIPNHSLCLLAEPNAGEFEAVRLDLQQQVVYRYVDYSISQQEGFVRGEN